MILQAKNEIMKTHVGEHSFIKQSNLVHCFLKHKDVNSWYKISL